MAVWPRIPRLWRTRKIAYGALVCCCPALPMIRSTRIASTAFSTGLAQLGWIAGRNIRIDIRWGAVDADRCAQARSRDRGARSRCHCVVWKLNDCAIATSDQDHSHCICDALDPVGAGIVESMARPGSNITGFATLDYEMSGKWLELLKEIAPGVTRAAVIRDPTTAAGIGQFAAIQSAASSRHVALTPINLARRRRSRTRCCGLCADQRRRPHCHAERYYVVPSRLDRQARGEERIARRLFCPCIRKRRRPNRLWA